VEIAAAGSVVWALVRLQGVNKVFSRCVNKHNQAELFVVSRSSTSRHTMLSAALGVAALSAPVVLTSWKYAPSAVVCTSGGLRQPCPLVAFGVAHVAARWV